MFRKYCDDGEYKISEYSCSTHPHNYSIQILAEADAFCSLDLPRREALWAAKAIISQKPLPLFSQDLEGEAILEDKVYLRQMTEGEEVIEDYVAMRLTLRAHPVALIRHLLTPEMC